MHSDSMPGILPAETALWPGTVLMSSDSLMRSIGESVVICGGPLGGNRTKLPTISSNNQEARRFITTWRADRERRRLLIRYMKSLSPCTSSSKRGRKLESSANPDSSPVACCTRSIPRASLITRRCLLSEADSALCRTSMAGPSPGSTSGPGKGSLVGSEGNGCQRQSWRSEPEISTSLWPDMLPCSFKTRPRGLDSIDSGLSPPNVSHSPSSGSRSGWKMVSRTFSTSHPENPLDPLVLGSNRLWASPVPLPTWPSDFPVSAPSSDTQWLPAFPSAA